MEEAPVFFIVSSTAPRASEIVAVYVDGEEIPGRGNNAKIAKNKTWTKHFFEELLTMIPIISCSFILVNCQE